MGTFQLRSRSHRRRLAAPAAGPAGPTIVTVGLSGDTYIEDGDTEANHGDTTTLLAGLDADGNSLKRALLVPDLSAIPAGATVTAATLTLYVQAQVSTDEYSLGLYLSLVATYPGEPGSDEHSCYSYQQTNATTAWPGGVAGGTAGTDYALLATDTAPVSAVGDITFDVAADVAAWIAGTANAYGWWLINAGEEDRESEKTISSLNHATADKRPSLQVTYTT